MMSITHDRFPSIESIRPTLIERVSPDAAIVRVSSPSLHIDDDIKVIVKSGNGTRKSTLKNSSNMVDLNVIKHFKEKLDHIKRPCYSDEESYGDSLTCPTDSSSTSQTTIEASVRSLSSISVSDTKVVRFQMTDDNHVACVEYEGWQEPFTAQEIAKMWYSPLEMQIIKRYIKKDTLSARKDKDYVESFKKLFSACGNQDELSTYIASSSERVTESEKHYRGLELLIFGPLGQRRRNHSHEIVQLQKSLFLKSVPSEELDKILAKVCASRSRRARIRAHVHGVEDAMIASLEAI